MSDMIESPPGSGRFVPVAPNAAAQVHNPTRTMAIGGPMTTESRDALVGAKRWMSALPRDQFDKLLVLVHDAADRERARGDAVIAAERAAVWEAAAAVAAQSEADCQKTADKHALYEETWGRWDLARVISRDIAAAIRAKGAEND